MLSGFPLSLDWLGDAHLRVRWADGARVVERPPIPAALQRARTGALPGFIDATPASNSLLLRFDPCTLDPAAARMAVQNLLNDVTADAEAAAARTVEVPVCYQGEHAPDLPDVAVRCDLSAARLVDLHASAEHVVRFIGFAPGFPYIDGLPAPLHVPRLDAPRPRVPAGSVAIAGSQTCIYPHPTPGGWRIIGRTPLRIFDAARTPPAMLAPGDRVRFVPISATRFDELRDSHA